MREWITPAKKQGISSDLIAVQVLTMTPQGAMEFESAGEEDDSEFDSEY
jgi:hypothetical protein